MIRLPLYNLNNYYNLLGTVATPTWECHTHPRHFRSSSALLFYAQISGVGIAATAK